VTRFYNQALRPDGIEITQFTLLMALDRTGETTQGALAELLALDSTTLTRMLSLTKKRRWIQIRQGNDRRHRLVSLTTAGRQQLQHSMPRWAQAQKGLEAALGHDAFAQLGGVLADFTAAARRS
jgi:DNA-binding MarR family transcriptional regulator